jgi:UDP-GlcNAc:undecaprenyl-phosphate/decaprenyl-phosphate GlcNAc-1-phosphate transferase
MIFFSIFIVGAIASAASTLLIRRWAIKNGIVNKPNPIVPQHTKPIAYLGGVGVFGGLIPATISAAFFGGTVKYHPVLPFGGLIFGATGFLVFGILDDLKTYNARTKLIWQTILAVISVSLGLKGTFFNVPAIDFLFTVLWIITIVNAVNLTDVCDGLVSGLCEITFLSFAFLNPSLSLFGIVTAGATLGFLFFNFPRASIFLGDAGAHLLGFLLAAACILGFPHHASIAARISWMVLIPGVMLFEIIFLTVVRTQKGLPWWKGSPDHFSLRLQAGGYSRLQTDAIAWSFNLAFVVIAHLMPNFAGWIQYTALICILIVLVLVWKFLVTREVNKLR